MSAASIMMRRRHDEYLRTTVDLPADLHAQAVAIARDAHRTLTETVALSWKPRCAVVSSSSGAA
jgi:hypothetical protein